MAPVDPGQARIEWAEKPWCLARSGKLADATIFMSSATDPYQGVERRLVLRGARSRPSCGIRDAVW